MAESPAYYTRGSIECWDFIRDQELNYHLGCAIKYIVRAGHKISYVSDLEKAIHYLQNELDNTLLNAPNPNGYGSRLQSSLWSYDEWDSESDSKIFDR